MGFSYSENPASSDRDQLRFLIQDTNCDDVLFQDAELDWLLLEAGSPLNAAIRAVETLLAKWAGKCDEKVGQVSVSFSQKVDNYKKLLETLKRRVGISGGVPYAGGIRISDKQRQREDGDRVSPAFTKHRDDFPQNSQDNEEGYDCDDRGDAS